METFHTDFFAKIVLMFVWKRPKINEKEVVDGQCKKEYLKNFEKEEKVTMIFFAC